MIVVGIIYKTKPWIIHGFVIENDLFLNDTLKHGNEVKSVVSEVQRL